MKWTVIEENNTFSILTFAKIFKIIIEIESIIRTKQIKPSYNLLNEVVFIVFVCLN